MASSSSFIIAIFTIFSSISFSCGFNVQLYTSSVAINRRIGSSSAQLLSTPSSWRTPSTTSSRIVRCEDSRSTLSPLFTISGKDENKDIPSLISSSSSSLTPSSSSTSEFSKLSSLSTIVVVLYRILMRMDTVLERSELDPSTIMTAGIAGSVSGLVGKVKSIPTKIKNFKVTDIKPLAIIGALHNPVTYMVLAVMAANKYKWMWQNPFWWFGVAFCIKWFRARYVFKIPVWDRQPNWNNVITSKEQEKDLKAFTCKNCGSTIFIAKTREFFFEGTTGIGGLGCFSCGAKGKDNFVMDRDRIVEDVADIDDYFEYERPLDFISSAERRKLMREAGGDEEKANQILIERTNAQASKESQATAEAIVNGGVASFDGAPAAPEVAPEVDDEVEDESLPVTEAVKVDTPEIETDDEPSVDSVKPAKKESVSVPTSKPPQTTTKASKSIPSNSDEDELDALGMDDF